LYSADELYSGSLSLFGGAANDNFTGPRYIECFIYRGNSILATQRNGQFVFPGCLIQGDDKLINCARGCVEKYTGYRVRNVKLIGVTCVKNEQGVVSQVLMVVGKAGKQEPEKCEK
jgi:hypothetical protein